MKDGGCKWEVCNVVQGYDLDRLRAQAIIVMGVHQWQGGTGRVQAMNCICIHGAHMKLVHVDVCYMMDVCVKFGPVFRFRTTGVRISLLIHFLGTVSRALLTF